MNKKNNTRGNASSEDNTNLLLQHSTESNSSICSISSVGNTSTRDVEIDVVGDEDDDENSSHKSDYLNVDNESESEPISFVTGDVDDKGNEHRRLTEEERIKLGFNLRLSEDSSKTDEEFDEDIQNNIKKEGDRLKNSDGKRSPDDSSSDKKLLKLNKNDIRIGDYRQPCANSMNLTFSFFNNRSILTSKPRRLNPFSIESLLSRAETMSAENKDVVSKKGDMTPTSNAST